MELKIGDYIRTNDGIITKVSMKIEDMIYFDDVVKKHFSDSYEHLYESELNDYIFKSSPNIIDLIECGDYVLTEYYDLFRKVGLTDEDELMLETYIEDNVVILVPITKILKICTKENFERVSYDVKNN